MSIAATLDTLHAKARGNKWLWLFAIFNRVALAAGFLPSGYVKIVGERFTNLSNNHPMGAYLEALHHTGYYYTMIGILQMSAAVLLLVPRTATLGAVVYFPIILNICILSLAVRFDGSLLSSPLMVLANLYLLCWDYHKLKFILPWSRLANPIVMPKWKDLSNKFPFAFAVGSFVVMATIVLILTNIYEIKPRNTIVQCKKQIPASSKPQACNNFCNCIHLEGKSLEKCLETYEKAPKEK